MIGIRRVGEVRNIGEERLRYLRWAIFRISGGEEAWTPW